MCTNTNTLSCNFFTFFLFLKCRGADPNFENKRGQTALDMAYMSMNWKMIDLLENFGGRNGSASLCPNNEEFIWDGYIYKKISGVVSPKYCQALSQKPYVPKP